VKENARILVVDDEPMVCLSLTNWLKEENYWAYSVEDGASAIAAVHAEKWDIVLLDLKMPGMDGLEVLRQIKSISPQTVVVMMTAYASIPSSVQAMKEGAYDYVVKPLDVQELTLMLQKIVEHQQLITENILLRKHLTERYSFEDIIGKSEPMQRVFEMISTVADTSATVLITGETGTGKSTIARWLHRHGPRAAGPMVEVNCSALPDTLAESELFGHERGAFTDARAARQGLFEAAHGGTLFLDELPSLSLPLQAKLLTALEDRRIRRLGGNRQIEVDVRIIAATSRDLRVAAAAGDFREDLLHRLDLYRVSLPPLRERGPDLLRLAEHLIARICRRHRLPPRQVAEAGRQRLLTYRWPGNVRELAHELERALVFEDAAALDFAHLPDECGMAGTARNAGGDWLNPQFAFPEQGFALEEAINRLLQLALKQSSENISRAARLLGVTRDFVRYRLYGDRKGNHDSETSKE